MSEETEAERMDRLARDKFVRPLPKKFYKLATVSDKNGILLDGKPVKTPLKAELVLPNARLAEAIAAEWNAQDKVIAAHMMTLTKLANTAIDRTALIRAEIFISLAEYAGSDLVCYRAEAPEKLVALQDQHWTPICRFIETKFGTAPKIIKGIVHVPQPKALLSALASAAERFDDFHLTVLQHITNLLGSVFIPLMLIESAITEEAAWQAASLDERFQMEQWGIDAEGEARLVGRENEFKKSCNFLNLLR